jgi:enamine deaminase RidA (YjgF/YER057c/UK114 family)
VTRRSIGVDGIDHGDQPFPLASRVGPFLATSGIHGTDPTTGKLAAGAEAQIRQAFANLRALLEAAGATPADVAQVLVTLAERSDRAYVNESWVDLFPDAESRPARNTSERELPAGSRCQLVAYAYICDHKS